VLVEGTPKNSSSQKFYHSSIVHNLVPELLKKEFLPKILKEQKPVGNAVRLSPQTAYVKHNEYLFEEDNFYFTESSLFDVFDFPLTKGDPKTALSNNNSIVLSQEMAQKYFGLKNPVGQKMSFTIFNTSQFTFTITGVLKPIPKNSSLKIDFLAAFSFDKLKAGLPDWIPLYTYSYIKFDWYNKYMLGYGLKGKIYRYTPTLLTIVDAFKKQLVNVRLKDYYSDKFFNNWNFTLEPLKVSLFGEKKTFIVPTSEFDKPLDKRNWLLVLFLSVMGVLILGISCINAINLSIARSTNRAKEIAVRKVMGADRQQLIFQFLTESILLSILSLVFAVSLVELFLPYFSKMVHQQLILDYLKNWGYLAAMGGIVIITGIVSGLYPAFFLSSFQPVETLKGENLLFSKKLRRLLIIFQITVSICMFIFSFLFFQETNFLRDKSLGFNKNQVIFFKIDDVTLKDKYSAFKSALLQLPGVARVTRSGLAAWNFGTTGLSTVKCLETGITVQARLMLVDSDYLDVYEIPVIQGKNFSDTQENCENFCIINDAAKNILKIDDIANKTLIQEDKHTRQIIGAARDFHFQYPFKKIDPLVMVATNKYYGMSRPYISVRLLPFDHKETIIKIKKAANRFFPEIVFSYDYVDKEIEKMHRQKNDPWKNILKFFTWISVFLACLGLFGFAGYELDRKTKEIGIRKVLGAIRLEIAGYFIKQFALIAIIANLIAWPITYLFTKLVSHKIEYPYTLNLELPIFISVTLFTLVFTVAIVSMQIFKAASIDPQDALRDE
ncbi:MAG: FtsX-like permease family protein, partial [Desulfobacula sp.]|nr:FtsX-like permease family protein [Desulfobacula sp.]